MFCVNTQNELILGKKKKMFLPVLVFLVVRVRYFVVQLSKGFSFPFLFLVECGWLHAILAIPDEKLKSRTFEISLCSFMTYWWTIQWIVFTVHYHEKCGYGANECFSTSKHDHTWINHFSPTNAQILYSNILDSSSLQLFWKWMNGTEREPNFADVLADVAGFNWEKYDM